MRLLCRQHLLDCYLLQLLHDLDALSKSLSSLRRFVHLDDVSVHFVKVLVDELVDDLRGKVHPNVKNSVLTFAFKGIKKVLLNVGDNGMSSAEVQLVPLSVGLP